MSPWMTLLMLIILSLYFSVCPVFYDISVLANPLTWILLLTLIVSIITQVSCKVVFVLLLIGCFFLMTFLIFLVAKNIFPSTIKEKSRVFKIIHPVDVCFSCGWKARKRETRLEINPLILPSPVCLCRCLQVNYLNKSLDTFNTLLVYPIYYVLFTSVVLSTSIILFQEWRSMAAVDVVTTLGAFVVIVVGVAMLHLFKEMQVGGPSTSFSS